MARNQILEVRRDVPIVIETPEGLIQILRPQSSQYRKKILVDLPGEMRAFVGLERAMEHARFLVMDGDGMVTPQYTILAAVRGDDGSLVGVRTQQFMRLADPGPIRLASG